MFRRPVLAALAAGIAANDDDVARAALRRYDPILRGFARRRLERALIDAALLLPGVPAPAHVMRLAALAVGGRQSETTDEAEVTRAYEVLPRPAMPRLPLFTVVTALVTAVCLSFGTVYVLHAVAKKSRLYARPLPPPAAGAFTDGGVPLRDPALDKLLNDGITTLVADTGRSQERGTPVAPILAAIHDPKEIAAHGAQLATAWRGMIDAYGRAASANDQRAADDLREAAREVTGEFARVGLGYFIEGRVRRNQPILQSYQIEEIEFVVAGGARRRVLSLRRLDHLNLSWALLGMQSEDIGDPVVLLDQIDENVATTVFPVLVVNAPYVLADEAWLATDVGQALSRKVGGIVRTELSAALGKDAIPAGKIAALLVERKRIIDEWRDHLDQRGMVMVDTDDLYVPDGLLDNLDGVVPKYQRERVAAIEDEITNLEAPRIASVVRELVVSTVRRHEAQHGFDDDRETELRYPTRLADMLGRPIDDEGNAVPIVRSARAELSAYLSQIVNDPVTPHMAFWNLARQVFSKDRQGTGESYAAIVVIEGLARHLGAPDEEGYAFDRERLARLATAIADAPADRLRKAATDLWSDLYGEPATMIVDAPGHAITATR